MNDDSNDVRFNTHELYEIMINYKDLTNQDYRQGSIAFPVPVTKQAFLTG